MVNSEIDTSYWNLWWASVWYCIYIAKKTLTVFRRFHSNKFSIKSIRPKHIIGVSLSVSFISARIVCFSRCTVCRLRSSKFSGINGIITVKFQFLASKIIFKQWCDWRLQYNFNSWLHTGLFSFTFNFVVCMPFLDFLLMFAGNVVVPLFF